MISVVFVLFVEGLFFIRSEMSVLSIG